MQSAIDPLDPAMVAQLPLYAHASPLAFVLSPGEAVVIPQVRRPPLFALLGRALHPAKEGALCAVCRAGGTMRLP